MFLTEVLKERKTADNEEQNNRGVWASYMTAVCSFALRSLLSLHAALEHRTLSLNNNLNNRFTGAFRISVHKVRKRRKHLFKAFLLNCCSR